MYKMQADCVICMEHFESSEAISTSECGHVFHSACITQWLDESDTSTGLSGVGQCPQCRSTVDRKHLVRLFFSESCSTKDTSTGELRAQLKLANERIEEMTKQQALSEQELKAKESQLNKCHVEEKLRMDRALEHSKVRIESLALKCESSATLVARLKQEHIEEMSKQQAVCEQKLKTKESQLIARQVESLGLERACTCYKSKLEHAHLLIDHLELKCEHNATLVARLEKKRKDAMSTRSMWRLLDVNAAHKRRETLMKEQFEAKLNQLAVQIDNFDQKYVYRMNKINDLDRMCARLEATKLASEPPQKSNRMSSNAQYGHEMLQTQSRTMHTVPRSQIDYDRYYYD